jgi:SNF2 family DNA or RNA helicase
VKNAGAKAAAAVRALKADHRLALTGTPVENHLGELWAQQHWLNPGLLGDHARFERFFRKPIERDRDPQRLDLLRRRVAPFLLRRTKAAVAAELPPKTEATIPVELSAAERALYEAIRAALDRKVRDALAQRGLARSQIVVLDALLKLRQCCCHPHLVGTPLALRTREASKLDALSDLLPTLVEDGRRILVFSQFTSMLALIRAELERLGLAHCLLTGETVDRQGEIDRFQRGEVPIFLLSLKAGGVGLNLTAADAVVLYDPWWNPAVEDQAIDRAHRIGQDKPVFVYRLMVEGSVEERMVELQRRKRALASALYGDDGQLASTLSEADVAALLAPLG